MYSLVASAIVLLLCSVVVPLDALPGGAPLGACQSLTPSHTGATSRPNPGPTMLNLASFMDASGTLTYIPGETYEGKSVVSVAPALLHAFPSLVTQNIYPFSMTDSLQIFFPILFVHLAFELTPCSLISYSSQCTYVHLLCPMVQ